MLVISALPQILLVGVAGRLADRIDPRPAPVSGAIVQLAAALALAWWTDLVATAIGVVVLQAGFAVANSAWVVALPRLVPDELAGSFISVHHALLGIAVPVGAALGGSASQFGLSEAVAGGAAVLGALLAGSLTSTRARARAILVLLGAVAIAPLVQDSRPVSSGP